MSDAVDVAGLLARRAAERLHWVDVEPGCALHVRRPTQTDMVLMRGQAGRDLFAAYAAQVVGWRGFTAAVIGGPADKPLPFSDAVWAALWPDRVDWVATLGERLPELFLQHQVAREAAEKN